MTTLQKPNIPFQKLLFSFILIILFLPVSAFAQGNDGEKIFKSTCAICHTIGHGKSIGPDLANIYKRLKKRWLMQWIQSSQRMVKSGDPEAIKIFNEYHKVPMPDNSLTNAQIIGVLNYIKEKSPKEATSGETGTPALTSQSSLTSHLNEAGEKEAGIGQQYFTGKKRFKNRGPACLSCHNVTKAHLIEGGLLGKNLTKEYTKLNAEEINEVISSPPFPIMEMAFKEKPLTKNEKYYLLAFLKIADREAVGQPTVSYNKSFIYGGITGVISLFVFFEIYWFRRRKFSVK